MAEDINYTPALGVASTLVQATGDAMDNIFDVLVTFPWDSAGSYSAETSYRCKDFQPPKPEKSTHDNAWHGQSVPKVNSGIKLDRHLKLQFRLDATWALYNKFVAWSKVTGDVNTGGVANTNSALGTIKVLVPGAEYNATASWNAPGNSGAPEDLMLNGKNGMKNTSMLYWNFSDVQCLNVGTPKWDNKVDGKEIWYEVEFIFGDIAYPFYTNPSGSGK